MHAVLTVEDAVDAAVLRAYVRHVLVPTLRRGDIVVMDNLRVDNAQGVETMIAGAETKLIYLPPYPPDWSSIEPCWSKIKTRLRGMKIPTREALDSV